MRIMTFVAKLTARRWSIVLAHFRLIPEFLPFLFLIVRPVGFSCNVFTCMRGLGSNRNNDTFQHSQCWCARTDKAVLVQMWNRPLRQYYRLGISIAFGRCQWCNGSGRWSKMFCIYRARTVCDIKIVQPKVFMEGAVQRRNVAFAWIIRTCCGWYGRGLLFIAWPNEVRHISICVRRKSGSLVQCRWNVLARMGRQGQEKHSSRFAAIRVTLVRGSACWPKCSGCEHNVCVDDMNECFWHKVSDIMQKQRCADDRCWTLYAFAYCESFDCAITLRNFFFVRMWRINYITPYMLGCCFKDFFWIFGYREDKGVKMTSWEYYVVK